MKKILYSVMVVATLAATTACNETKPLVYSVKGTVPDSLNGKNVYLNRREIKDKRIASTVIENGQFAFSDTIESPLVAQVVIKGAKDLKYHCALDEVPVVMNYDGKECSITGSHRTDAMVEYDAIRAERSKNIVKRKFTQVLAAAYTGGGKVEYTKEDQLKDKEAEVKNRKAKEIYHGKVKELLKRNADNVAGAFIFSGLYTGSGIEEETTLQDSILSVAGKEFLETPHVQRIIAAHNQRVGKTYTDFELPDVDGKMHRLSDIVGEGKYVLVDVWASWCHGCRMETPHVKEAYAKYHDRGFEVVMVSIDADKPDWLKAMEKDGIQDMGYQLIDTSSIIRKIYGIPYIPCTMLIDPQGKIIANDLRENDLENQLSKVIGE